MSTHAGSGSPVSIQISPQSIPSTPPWFGEVAAFAQVLAHVGILKAIREQVRFTRARFGQYDLIDFGAVLIGYAVSGEPTLQSFYERHSGAPTVKLSFEQRDLSCVCSKSPCFSRRVPDPRRARKESSRYEQLMC